MAGLTLTAEARTRWARWALSVGVLALLFAGGAYFVVREWSLWVRVPLGVALTGLGFSLLLDPALPQRLWKRPGAQYGTHALLTLTAFTGILVLVNLLPYWFPQRWDWTEEKRHTLAPEIQELLRRIPEPVTAYAFFTPQTDPSLARDLLENFAYYGGDRFRYEIIDPLTKPGLAQKYGVTRDGTVVLVLGDRYEQVTFLTEEELARALVRLLHPERRTVAFLTGHGERDIQGQDERGYARLRQELEAKNYHVRTLDLALEGYQVPEGVQVIVVADPQRPLEAQEMEALKAFVDAGGSLVLWLNTPVESPEGVSPALTAYLQETWGLLVQDTVIVDPSSPQPGIALAAQYAQHPITERLQGWRTYFPLARTLDAVETLPEGVSLMPLVVTSPQAWGETDLAPLQEETGGDVAFDPETDIAGPLVVAVAAEGPSGARLVVVGDADFAANLYYGELGNGLLAMNMVDWAAEQEDLINITPRTQIQRRLNVPSAAFLNLLTLTTACLLPAGVVVLGAGVWAYRRMRG